MTGDQQDPGRWNRPTSQAEYGWPPAGYGPPVPQPGPYVPPMAAPVRAKHAPWPWFIALAAALLFGIVIGNAGKGSAAAHDTAPTVTRTVTKTVDVTPTACTIALTEAEDALTLSADAMKAVGNLDNAEVEKDGQEIRTIAPVYRADAARCRAGD